MKKVHSPNWGGPGRGQGRKPSCALCHKPIISKDGPILGGAIKLGREWFHTDCLEASLRNQAPYVEAKAD